MTSHANAGKHGRATQRPPARNRGDQPADASVRDEARDDPDPGLRHRLISETAYRRYVDRGCADGYDMEDWLDAEAAVDHALRYPEQDARGGSPG